MTRKEILNSSEYWQEMAEIQCYNEGIDCTIQLVDKQQLIDKVCEWIKENIKNYVWCRFDEICISENIEKDFKQSMKG